MQRRSFPCVRHDVLADDGTLNRFTTTFLPRSLQYADRAVEEGEIPEVSREFEPRADRPDLLRLLRALLADEPVLVPRRARRSDGRKLGSGHQLASIEPSQLKRRHRAGPCIMPPPFNVRICIACQF